MWSLERMENETKDFFQTLLIKILCSTPTALYLVGGRGRAARAGNVCLLSALILSVPSPFFFGPDMLRLWREKRRRNPSATGVMFSRHRAPYRWLITLNSKTYRSIRNVNILPATEGDLLVPVFAMCAQRGFDGKFVRLVMWGGYYGFAILALKCLRLIMWLNQ